MKVFSNISPLWFLAAYGGVCLATVGSDVWQANGSNAATGAETLVLPATGPSGRPVEELSGLAWDQQAGLLYAVSDGGWLHHIAIDFANETPVAARIVWSGRLERHSSGTRNAEGLALRQGAAGTVELLVALEKPSAAGVYSADGKFKSEIELPQAVLAAVEDAGGNKGLEAIAPADDGALFAVPESNEAGGGKLEHILYRFDTGGLRDSLAFAAAGGATRVKAVENLGGGRMAVLEREEDAGAYKNWLRLIENCDAGNAKPCAVRDFTAEVSLPGSNLEGLAALPNGYLVLVEDRKREEGPSRLTFVKHAGQS